MEKSKYLLTDSAMKCFLEGYVKDLNAQKYDRFKQSLANKDSIIVEETKESLQMTLQNDEDIAFVSSLSTESITNKIAEQLVKLLKKEAYNFVDAQIRIKMPIPIPFVMATAISSNNMTIVVDKNSQEWARYERICKADNVPCIGIPEYIKNL